MEHTHAVKQNKLTFGEVPTSSSSETVNYLAKSPLHNAATWCSRSITDIVPFLKSHTTGLLKRDTRN